MSLEFLVVGSPPRLHAPHPHSPGLPFWFWQEPKKEPHMNYSLNSLKEAI